MDRSNQDTLLRFCRALFTLITVLGAIIITASLLAGSATRGYLTMGVVTIFTTVSIWMFRNNRINWFINFMMAMLQLQSLSAALLEHYDGFFNYNFIFFGFIAYFLNFIQKRRDIGLFWVAFSMFAFFFSGFNSYSHWIGNSIENPTLTFQLIPPVLGFVFASFTLYYFMEFFQFQEVKIAKGESELGFLRNFQQTIANFTKTPIAVVRDKDERVVFTNEAFSNMLGFPLSELVGQPIKMFQYTEGDTRRVLSQGKELDVPLINESGDILLRDVEANDFEFNNIPYKVIFYHDSSIRKLEEAKLRRLIENTPLSITQVTKDGKIIYTNHYLEEITGYDLEHIYSDVSFMNTVIPNEKARREILKKRKELIKEARINEVASFGGEIKLTRKDGEIRFVKMKMILFEEFDLFVMQDITEEHFTKQELEQLVAERAKALASSEEKLKAVINSIPDALYYKGIDGSYIGCNFAFSTFVGLAEDKIIGKTDAQLFSEERQAEIQNTDKEVFENKATVVTDEVIVLNNRNNIYLSTIKAPFFDADGQLVGLVGISRDISNIHQAIEQERKLNKMKSQFITMASHQFKTPLTAILASTELLNVYQEHLNGKIATSIGRQTARITTEVDRLNALMNDILILGKAETEKAIANIQNTDLVQWAKQIIQDHFSNEPDGRTVDFSVSGAPFDAPIDKYMMSHVVSNLLSNAFKYSKDKPNPNLHLQFDTRKVKIQVKDFGIGIPEAERENLFEAFFRAKNVGGIPGTGMGLVVANEFVKLHRGNIKVESIENEGTTVTVILPFLKD